MIAFARHFAFEFKTGLRNPSLLLLNYLFPLGLFAMMGVMMTKINPLFKETMVPAMVIIAAISSAVMGLPGPQIEAREGGIFRSFKINGVPVVSILVVPALSSFIHIVIASTVITLTGPALFGGHAPVHWVPYIITSLVMIFTFTAFGSLIGVISGSARSSILWSQLIFLPSMLIGGLMVPAAMLPSSIRTVSGLLPTTYSMQAYLGLAYGQKTLLNPTVSLLILLAGGVLALALAAYLFNWDSRNKSRRGHPLLALLVLVPFIIGIGLM